jgi:Methyltransferase domain
LATTTRSSSRQLVRPLRKAARVARELARAPRRIARDREIRRRFVSRFLRDPELLAVYEQEIRDSGLLEHLREKRREFIDAARGTGYTIGAIEFTEGVYLYSILRQVKPRLAVETGVCNGFSTAFALQALHRNGEGELHSIDLPREIGKDYEPDEFFTGEGRAGVPPGKEPGWLIPDRLREHWTLILGKSQDELPGLLGRLGTVEFFMHDSEHSFDCMSFEYNEAWPALAEGGVLISDDVNSTEAFPRFSREQHREPVKIGIGLAFLVK